MPVIPECKANHLPENGTSSSNILMTKDLFARPWNKSLRSDVLEIGLETARTTE
jgi:hypothetical protein